MTDTRVDNEEVRAIWDENAAFWDEQMGEGNQFQRLLIGPTTERLLNIKPGETVLDVACGNGVSSRRLAALGANVVACDFSKVFIERAKARTTGYDGQIEYRVIDATNVEALRSLGERRFDAALCNMAFMDMIEIEPLFQALPYLLKPNGRFVWSVVHPCFNSVNVTRVIEEEDVDERLVTRYGVKVWTYATPTAKRGIGMRDQPEAHYYFHRPINVLLNVGFDAGFVLDGFEEPTFEPDADAEHFTSWANFTEIPPVLFARMRLRENA